MIGVTSDALGNDFALRTMASRAACFGRHQNVGRLATLRRGMANFAIERFLRRGIDLVLGVIEIRLRHPTLDQNWFGDCRDSIRGGFHFMTKRAAGEISARGGAQSLLRLVRIFGEENRAFELVAGMKLIAERFNLLSDEA